MSLCGKVKDFSIRLACFNKESEVCTGGAKNILSLFLFSFLHYYLSSNLFLIFFFLLNDQVGCTAVHLATRRSHTQIIDYLCSSAHCDVNIQNRVSEFDRACLCCQRECVS